MNRALLFLVGFPAICSAGPNEYVCTIKSELYVNDDGVLTPHAKPIEIGAAFTIDRKTGTTMGRPFSNATAREVKIITQGSASKNFEVLSASSPNGKATTDLVVIQEWHKGIEKPFVAVSSGTAYSGVCK